MKVQLKENFTIPEFQAFIDRAENAEKRFELIGGEIVEVPSNPYVSVIAARIIGFLSMFLFNNNVKGHVSGADGGFIIKGQVFAPDVAYMLHLPTNQGFEQQPPLLAVEVISDPSSSAEQTDLRRKLVQYRAAGVTTWIVDYQTRRVEVHLPDGSMQIYDDTMSLSGGEILPGFELSVSAIFPQKDVDETE